MWAKFPADFTIWLKSVLAWRYAVISYSYFANWACALMDSNATTIGLLPAGIILFLIPKCGKMGFCIILSLSLLFILLGWLCSLLCLWVMSRDFVVHWLVVNWFVMNWYVSINFMVFCS